MTKRDEYLRSARLALHRAKSVHVLIDRSYHSLTGGVYAKTTKADAWRIIDRAPEDIEGDFMIQWGDHRDLYLGPAYSPSE